MFGRSVSFGPQISRNPSLKAVHCSQGEVRRGLSSIPRQNHMRQQAAKAEVGRGGLLPIGCEPIYTRGIRTASVDTHETEFFKRRHNQAFEL